MSPEQGVRAVSFDLDDTFWDCAPAIAHAEATLAEWLDREAPDVLDQLARQSLPERRQRLVDAQPELAGDVTVLRKRMLAEVFREAGIDHAKSEEAFDVFYRARSQVVLYDGVTALLEALRPRYKVAAITNGNADLGVVGIAGHFDIVLRATLDLQAKPHPQMFELALHKFGLQPAQMLHVGDNVVTDVQGAQQAGVGSVWFNAPGSDWPVSGPAPDYTVRSITELHHLLLD